MHRLVNINDIRARLITTWPDQKLVRLQDTPHWQFLNGNKQPYIDYLEKANQPEHSVQKFEALITNFNLRSLDFIECIEKDNKYIISDGFHRACIFLHKGITEIVIVLIK